MTSNRQPVDLTGDDEGERERPRKRARTAGSTLRDSISPPRPRNNPSPSTSSKKSNENSHVTPPGSIISSPFQLTSIRDLPGALNKDAVSLQSLICDPMIAEMWEFNYMHDLDFLMSNLDPDTRDTVRINVVHGYWKKDSGLGMKSQAPKYPNIKLHCAYMPEMFGTHHTKMIILIRHDDQAQIIIHTANMIAQDWANMSDAVWRSPLLPFLPADKASDLTYSEGSKTHPYGSGLRFKLDLLNYLRFYDHRRSICKPLIEQLVNYDFSSIRGALVGHVPGRHHLGSDSGTLFGWPAIRDVLKDIPVSGEKGSEIIAQVSSIATVGGTDAWVRNTILGALSVSKNSPTEKPGLGIIFPTPEEIRTSLDGYDSGGSIHTKIQTPAQQKQLDYLRPLLYHWAGDDRPPPPPASSSTSDATAHEAVREAGRKRAAPHIKTYIRFSSAAKTSIDWALLTSSNLSKQAWGDATNAAGEVRVSSYELGVLVAPSMYAEDAVMVPTFKVDRPEETVKGKVTVGCRMPYDLPLVRYRKDEEPWCATKPHGEPDWMGRTWEG